MESSCREQNVLGEKSISVFKGIEFATAGRYPTADIGEASSDVSVSLGVGGEER